MSASDQPSEAGPAPARSRSQRTIDTLERLRTDVDLWAAAASEDGHAYLVPLSYLWDGERITHVLEKKLVL